ncbi:MAG: matrixin family metalloprotease [Nitrososphaeraceae archaeon]
MKIFSNNLAIYVIILLISFLIIIATTYLLDKKSYKNLVEFAYAKTDSIKICCTWGEALADGTLTYKIINKKPEFEEIVNEMLNKWKKSINKLNFMETKNNNPDIEFIFVKDKGKTAGQTITSFDEDGLVNKNEIFISEFAFNEKLDKEVIKQVTKHEIGHALGLGHADFEDNVMSSLIYDKEIEITKCEVDAVIKANEWKFNSKYKIENNLIYKTETKMHVCEN